MLNGASKPRNRREAPVRERLSKASVDIRHGRGKLLAVALGSTLCVAVSGLAHGATLDKKLPPGTLRGPISRLQQYPTLSLATPKQLAAAKRLRRAIWTGSRAWRSPRDAAALGYAPARLGKPGNSAGLFLHAENRPLSNDEDFLNPDEP